MLSRFGIWLLVGICGDPTRCESPERLGRLVAMVIEWIDVTTSLMRDYVGELLKRLATQHASKWLTTVRDTKMELFCACLSPTPPEYAKVGGCWDSLSSPVNQLVEGLHRVCCLIPFQLVVDEVSNKVVAFHAFYIDWAITDTTILHISCAMVGRGLACALSFYRYCSGIIRRR